jgi:hypothetical protein
MQSYWSVIVIFLGASLIPILLLWLSTTFVRRMDSGLYWVAVWMPMGWLVSLPLMAHILAGFVESDQIHFLSWQDYWVLWGFAFIMLLIGFTPQLRPQSRTDRLNLFMFSLSWMGVMCLINFLWMSFMIFLKSFAQS